MIHLVWSEEIQKRVRTGDWLDQAISTVTKIQEAAAEGRNEDAAQLADYFLEEAKVAHDIYTGLWFPKLFGFLEKEAVNKQEIQSVQERVSRLLKGPSGEPFHPQEWWAQLEEKVAALVAAVRKQGAAGLGGLEDVRESWRQLHDRYADYSWGILTFIADRLGEERIDDAYRTIYPGKRYKVFDLRQHPYEETIFRNLYISFEAMRAHLCGPERKGDMEFREYDDRWTIEFDPCGSGGRAMRGDPVEGTGPRTEPPYGFSVTQKEYDWAWNAKGVCHYCAHCCLALQRIPAEMWGHPLRVVNPPIYPNQTNVKCRWTIYKTTEAIPEEAYRRVGLTKPRE